MTKQKTPTLKTPCRTPAGSGRAGIKQSASKRRGMLLGLPGISNNSYKKLARRAGIRRISRDVFDPQRPGSVPQALRSFLAGVLRQTVILVEHQKRYTVTPNDVALALKQKGITLYMQGADWTYGFFSRATLRKRVTAPLPRQLLEQVASERISLSQNQSRSHTWVAASDTDTSAGAAVTDGSVEVSAPPSQTASVAPVANDDRQPASRAVQVQLELQRTPAAALNEPAAEQENLPPNTVSQQSHTPVAAGKAGLASPEGTNQRQASINTPEFDDRRALTDDEAKEMQRWLSDVFETSHDVLQNCSMSLQQIYRVMWARHQCPKESVWDVVTALDREQRLMIDGDTVYICT